MGNAILRPGWVARRRGARDRRVEASGPRRDDPEPRQRLLDLGLIERVSGRRYMLSRRYYEFVGEKAAYTRKRGLDREQNLTLLLKHITDNAATGSPREELLQVVPALSESEVKSLLRTLQRRGLAHPVGMRRKGRWYPGRAPGTAGES